ncbi:hypothetical protein Q8A67_003864 [Cirrhinus molitorella]|uniref:Uncharacterized protein n=1 Tax=Cirrhinus molitorella TaxID=172907 RepID=A0AA88TWQ1_9TELE|nr:hypothetical protein Q8A67_003864 [Cirrhinus molitorella]
MVDAESLRGLTWGLPSSLPSTRPRAGGTERVKGHRSMRSTGPVLLSFSLRPANDAFAEIVWAGSEPHICIIRFELLQIAWFFWDVCDLWRRPRYKKQRTPLPEGSKSNQSVTRFFEEWKVGKESKQIFRTRDSMFYS